MRRPTVWLILLSCAVPRLAGLAIWPADTSTLYYQLSTGFLEQRRPIIGGELTTHIEPFYALVLALMRAATDNHIELVRVLQIALASFGGLLFHRLVRNATNDGRAAWMGALMYALSPYLIRQSVAFMEVTAAVVLLIAVALRLRSAATVAASITAGLLLAAAVLTRFSFLPIAAGGIGVAAARGGLSRGTWAAVACAALVVPWMVYSRHVSGAALPGRIGENLFESTSEWAESVGVPRTNVDVMMPELDEVARAELARRGNGDPTRVELDRVMGAWAWDFVRAHPFRVLRMKAANIGYALQPRLLPFAHRNGQAGFVNGRLEAPPQTPRPWPFEAAAAAFQSVLLVGAAAGLWLRRAHLLRDDAFLLVVALSVLALNVAFFPTSRLLAPMTFVLMFYTAVAGSRLRGTVVR